MKKESNNFWWNNELGSKRDMRNLLFDILNAIEFIYPAGYFKWKKNYRPFTNVFRRKDKLQKTVFTHSVLRDLLNLFNEYYGSNHENLSQISKIIKKSKYNVDISKSKDIDLGKFFNCEKNRDDCVDLNRNSIECKECDFCFASWFIKTVCYIEKNYLHIINNDNIVIENYKEKGQQELVDKIYNSICKYEEKLKTKTNLDILNDTCDIFNECIKCWDIANVADKKLAYIKWYTARLSTWPFLKKFLLKLDHYEEIVVFELLNSASKILNKLEKCDIHLLCEIETDKLYSYISLAYTNPFKIVDLEHYDTYKSYMVSKVIDNTQNEVIMAKAYLALLIISILTGRDDVENYQQKINNLNVDNSESLIIKAEYDVFMYLYDSHFAEEAKKSLQRINNNEYNCLNDYYDTFFTLAFLFREKYQKCGLTMKTNLYYELSSICSNALKVKKNGHKYSLPSKYNRPYCDHLVYNQFIKYEQQLNSDNRYNI